MRQVFFIITGLLLSAGIAHAQANDRAGIEFFESRIRPILVTHCYECHSADSAKARGGLKVDARDAIRAGGESGPAVVPASLEKSLLYKAITSDGEDQMPPKGKLPADAIADIRKWIQMGAPDPRVAVIGLQVQSKIDLEKGREFWAYRKVEKPKVPAVKDTAWPRGEIDRFILTNLEANRLVPVKQADSLKLVRRIYLVITGLPPSTEDVNTWTSRLDAEGPAAVARLVDELLASPRYGERWGRHWMDVARFAESTGGDQNNVFQHAWRYRDYVIDSFNGDKPFDQFIREQIAGDLLPIADDREWANNVIATGFLSVGAKLVGEEDQQKFSADLVDEQIDATTRAFLATSAACARCHDHKFDPIPQSDYYALAGIFRSTQTHYGLLKAQARQATTLIDLTGMGPPAGTKTLSKAEHAALVKARDDARQAVDDAMKKIRSGENVFRGTLRRLRSDRDETEMALQSYDTSGNPRVFAMGTQDRDFPLETRLLVRGELDKPAQVVSRGVLQILTPPGRYRLPATLKGSGRLELAEWIASADNPLTARVIVNRVWHWMFGQGIVCTVDDFGRSGELPSHPELLDYLAARFVEENWSIKSLIREIALSRTWQLASDHHAANHAVDPDNRLLWRANPRRIEAEAIRDAMLVVSGELNLKRPLGTLLQSVGEGNVGQNVFEPEIRAMESMHRSVYLPRVRNVLPDMLELFDAPDASLVAGARETTTSPLQALYLMNSPFVQDRASAAASRLASIAESKRIDAAYLNCYSRLPTEAERALAEAFIKDLRVVPVVRSSEPQPQTQRRAAGKGTVRGGSTGNSPNVAPARVDPWSALIQALMSSSEFQVVD